MSSKENTGSGKNRRTVREISLDFLGTINEKLESPSERKTRLTYEIREIRGPYGFLRKYFREGNRDYSDLRLSLNQARIAIPYDAYLAKITIYALTAAIIGLFAGLFLTIFLGSAGYLAGLRSPIGFSGSIARILESNALLIQGITISIITMALFGIAIWISLYYYPSVIAGRRRRNINIMLPHAITYMYALSHGGTDIINVIKKLSESEEAYGEIAHEFDIIVREMERFGTELPKAVQNARRITPNENLKLFLDDFLSVLDSGGNITRFLRDESERYFDITREEQKDFIETLGLLAEMYAAVFIAGPLLFIIILLVMSFVGSSTLPTVYAIVYIVIPVGIAAFGLVLKIVSQPYGSSFSELSSDYHINPFESTDESEFEKAKKDPRYQEFQRRKTLGKVREILSDPLVPIREKPIRTTYISLPLALILMLFMSATGIASYSGIYTNPIIDTTLFVVFPLMVVVVPLTWFHERAFRREKKVLQRFPDKMNAVSNANNMGLSLVESLNQVSKNSAGIIQKEFEKIHNDISWNYVTSNALIESANRIKIPQISRSMNLIAEASQSTGDLNRILEVAASDTMNEYRLRKERYREMAGYIAVIIISFLVYLAIILMLDVFYLTPLSEAIDVTQQQNIEIPDESIASLTDVPLTTYKMIFFHSALIQAFGNGLLAGMMGEGEYMNGLKYSIAFTLLTVIAFFAIA